MKGYQCIVVMFLFTSFSLNPLFAGQYQQLAQVSIELSQRFGSLSKLQHIENCKVRLLNDEIQLLIAHAELKEHNKRGALEAVSSILKDYRNKGFATCHYHQRIYKAINETNYLGSEIQQLPNM